MTEHERVNRAAWNKWSDDYQAEHSEQLGQMVATGELRWGGWGILESRLNVLGDVDGKDVLELGCGAAQSSLTLARRGASPIGLDLSERQLLHARRLMDRSSVTIPVVLASGERVPFADQSFDVVFADFGAFYWSDPQQTLPEASRVLRPGGWVAFTTMSPFYSISTTLDSPHAQERFVYDYFGLHTLPEDDGGVSFHLPFGEWIRLFRSVGLVLEELIEPRPDADARSTYHDDDDLRWARRWPMDCVWRARKPDPAAETR